MRIDDGEFWVFSNLVGEFILAFLYISSIRVS